MITDENVPDSVGSEANLLDYVIRSPSQGGRYRRNPAVSMKIPS